MQTQSIFPTRFRNTKEMARDAVGQPTPSLFRSGVSEFTKEALSAHARALHMLADGVMVVFCLAAAYAVRFDGVLTASEARQLLLWLPILLAARLLVNRATGVYWFLWRFVCLSDAIVIGRSLAVVTAVLLALRVFYPAHAAFSYWTRLPLSIIALEFLLSLSVCLSARAARRVFHEYSQKSALGSGQSLQRIVLYGAGRAGILLSRELVAHTGIEIAGFVDDNPEKEGTVISGIRVLGTGESLERIVRDNRVDEVVVSIATASPSELTRILAKCRRIPVPVRIIPSLQEILNRQASISHLREIRLEDLLGRDSTRMGSFDESVREAYRDKRILVTGAGGSIGSELTRQLLLLRPQKILILDKDENSIYELEQELKFRNPEIPIEPLIADIKIRERAFAVFGETQPQVVFHAAAHKHVPLMEKHPCEAVLNNVMGTKNVLEACLTYGAERFIFISTDKAVNPTNVMGATKKVGEMLVDSYVQGGWLRGACVRFGNVMGSRGSVIPLFQKQIDQGGPVTVTHPDIVRYFMTIPEAVQLVLSAGSLANGGDVFVLDMGSPRKILDLARHFIQLCGLEPGKDIQIAITGLRPGEKMNEELVGPNETLERTRFEKISAIRHAPFDAEAFRGSLAALIKAAQRNDRQAVYRTLSAMGLGYVPPGALPEERRLEDRSSSQADGVRELDGVSKESALTPR